MRDIAKIREDVSISALVAVITNKTCYCVFFCLCFSKNRRNKKTQRPLYDITSLLLYN